ncbi:MAG: histidinol-phosphate transaminase [Pseudomonadota bacterium]
MKTTIDDLVARLIRHEVRALSAYHVPDAAGLVKLDAMENPYGWPPALVDAWLARLRAARLNRYPDPAAPALKERLRTSMNIPADCAVLLGNGSDELIQMLMLAVTAPGRVVLSPEPSFAMYRLTAIVTGMAYAGVPLTTDFNLDTSAMLAAITRHQPALTFISYPNNPTGNLFDAEAVRAVIEASPGLVVLDEAYHVFAGRSFLNELARYPNVLILRTLSKMGLAGLRLGLLIGAPAWLTEIDKTRLPYNVNVLTQLSADFALTHQDVLDAQAQDIRRERERLTAALRGYAALTVYPSCANFILFRVPRGRADEIFAALKARGVLIKNLHGANAALHDCLRVTVGTPEENRAFLDALAQAV